LIQTFFGDDFLLTDGLGIQYSAIT